MDIGMSIIDLPAAGMDTVAEQPLVTAGGSAANCAATVARLGPTVDFTGVVGDDIFSRIIIEDLLSHRVGISGLVTTEGPSALMVALIDSTGQRTFVSARGPAGSALPPDVYLPLLDRASLAHVSGYTFQEKGSRSTALHILEEAHRRGIPTSLDPSPLFPVHFDPRPPWWRKIDYLFPNAGEAQAITGMDSPSDAAGALLDLGVRTVVITMGADGCLLGDETGITHFPAFTKLPVVDTTGAGDGFAGGFLAVILAGGSPRRAARIANLVAASVIAERGGHTGAPSPDQLDRLAEQWGDAHLQETALTLNGRFRAPGVRTGSRT